MTLTSHLYGSHSSYLGQWCINKNLHRLKTLAWMVVGLVDKKVGSDGLGALVSGGAQYAQSYYQQRWHHFLANPRIEVSRWYNHGHITWYIHQRSFLDIADGDVDRKPPNK